jgi:hypothetical protein
LIGVGLLMGEHRSLLRRKDPKAQEKLPFWKMGITWNLVPLAGFICGVSWAVIALNAVEIQPGSDAACCCGEKNAE